MSLAKLLKHFKDQSELPIRVDAIRAWIEKHYGYDLKISFIPCGLDKNILRGAVIQYEEVKPAYASLKQIAKIFYSAEQNPCWERFVLCKEMMHIFDPVETRTTEAGVDDLITRLMLPMDIASSPSLAYAAEHKAALTALFVLAPLNKVRQLKPEYQKGTLNDYAVAYLFRIPERYVKILMSDWYQPMHDMLDCHPDAK